jgi:hypothetical protein
LSGLRAHENQREVSNDERKLVYGAVAHAYVRRGIQHRYRPGGRGRMAALGDMIGATRYKPLMLVSPLHILLVLAVVIAPSRVVAWAVGRRSGSDWLTRSLRIILPQIGAQEKDRPASHQTNSKHTSSNYEKT